MANFSIVYVFLVLLGYTYPLINNIKNKVFWIRNLGLFFLALYTILIIKIEIFPIYFDSNVFNLGKPHFNLIPFNHIFKLSFDIAIKQMINEIIIFIPLGFLLPIAFERMDRIAATMLSILAVTVIIESIHFLVSIITGIPNGVTDIDDVLMNCFGGLCGYLIYTFTKRWIILSVE